MQLTVIVSSPTMVEPSSSVQVSTTGPDCSALNLNWMYGLADTAVSKSAANTCLPATVQVNLLRILRGMTLPARILALPGFHHVGHQRLDLDEVALLGFLLVELDARFDGHGCLLKFAWAPVSRRSRRS